MPIVAGSTPNRESDAPLGIDAAWEWIAHRMGAHPGTFSPIPRDVVPTEAGIYEYGALDSGDRLPAAMTKTAATSATYPIAQLADFQFWTPSDLRRCVWTLGVDIDHEDAAVRIARGIDRTGLIPTYAIPNPESLHAQIGFIIEPELTYLNAPALRGIRELRRALTWAFTGDHGYSHARSRNPLYRGADTMWAARRRDHRFRSYRDISTQLRARKQWCTAKPLRDENRRIVRDSHGDAIPSPGPVAVNPRLRLARRPDFTRHRDTESQEGRDALPAVTSATEGERHNTLLKVGREAGLAARRAGRDSGVAVRAAIEAVVCTPPLPEHEVEDLIASVTRFVRGGDDAVSAGTPHTRGEQAMSPFRDLGVVRRDREHRRAAGAASPRADR